MSTFARSKNHPRAFVVICVVAAFVWAAVLSVSPQLHQRVHADANRAEHNCAVTAITSGNCEHTVQPPLVRAQLRAVEFSNLPALTPQWAPSLFFKAHIFAHAPPASES